MMNRSKFAAVILVAGLMSLPALAQDKPAGPGGAGGPPPRGQGGPPRGPGGGAGGGPGGGMGGGMFGRPRLAPEKAKAAWEVQAKGVAADLSLDEAATGKVVAAYTTARTNHDAAIAKLMQELMDARMADGGPDAAGPGGGGGARGGGAGGPDDGGPPPAPRGGGQPDDAGGPPPGGPGAGPGGRGGMFGEMQKKMADLTKADRDSLKAELAKTLDAGKTDTAMASLGTFNPAWDVTVDAITSFKLDAAKNTAALNTLKAYNLELGKITPSDDREAMRAANTAARKTMTDSLKTILTEDQMKQFEAATSMGRGGRGGQGRGGRPPEGEL